MIHGLQEGHQDILHQYAILACPPPPSDAHLSKNPLRHFLMSHKICITQFTRLVLISMFFFPPVTCSFCFRALNAVYLCLQCSLTSPEHFKFPSHYNILLILNIKPTVADENEWPHLSVSISSSITADHWWCGGCGGEGCSW